MGSIVILVSCEHHFIRVCENLVQHPSNNISINLPKNPSAPVTGPMLPGPLAGAPMPVLAGSDRVNVLA